MNVFSSKKTLSIDFGAEEIKIVEGKYSKKGVVITRDFSLKIPKDIYQDGMIEDMDQLSYLLKTFLTENKITQSDVHAVINSSRVIMRETTMPNVSAVEIESILTFQLEDYIPVNPEDYVVKYITLGTIIEDDIEKLNLLLIGIPKTIIESHLNLLKNINLKPTVLDYQGNSISKLVTSSDLINTLYPSTDTIACIDLGFDSTSLTISKDGIIRVSRVVEMASKYLMEVLKSRVDHFSEEDLTNDVFNIEDINMQVDNKLVEVTRETLYEILDRVEMIFRYYRTRDVDNEIGLVLLMGGLSNINGIEKLFTDFFNVPCVKLNSLNKVKFNGDLSKYANAIGGLIRVGEV